MIRILFFSSLSLFAAPEKYFLSNNSLEKVPAYLQCAKNIPRVSGKVQYYDQNKNLIEEIACKNDQAHGEARWLYSDGKLRGVFHYEKGIKHGEEKTYFPDGSLATHGHYKQGIRHGEFDQYDPLTNVTIRYTYKEGTLVKAPEYLAKDPAQALVTAVRFQDVKEVGRLLAKNIGPFAHDGRHSTLTIAAGTNNTTILKMLLNAGVDPNGADPSGTSALSTAALSGSEEAARLLLKSGANPNLLGPNGKAPIHAASLHGQVAIGLLLLDAGANLLKKSNTGETAAQIAKAANKKDIVALLKNPKSFRASYNDKQRRDFCYQYSLNFAAERDDAGGLEQWFNKCPEFDVRKKQRAKALSTAAKMGKRRAVTTLLKHGAPLNSRKDLQPTPLIWASMNGHIDVLKILVKKGASIDAKDPFGNTGLTWAADRGHLDILTYLIEKGSDPNVANRSGKTPLIHAVESGNTEAVRVLLAKGALVKTTDADALMQAKKEGNKEIIKLLEKALN